MHGYQIVCAGFVVMAYLATGVRICKIAIELVEDWASGACMDWVMKFWTIVFVVLPVAMLFVPVILYNYLF